MLKYNWTNTTITTNKAANDMVKLFNKLEPKVGALDTETTGLHIITDKPFVVQFGFLHPDMPLGYTYAVDLERTPKLAKQVLACWNKLAESLDIYLGHNIKFDLHMLSNIGLPYTKENLSDTMFYIRFAFDARSTANGGPPMKLKQFATRYIDHNAKQHEKLLDAEKTAIAKELNLKLKKRLAKCGIPPAKYGAKSYTGHVIDKMFKDAIFDLNDLPENIKTEYLDWLHIDVPIYLQRKINGIVTSGDIGYNYLNRANLIKYAHYDIIYTLEVYLLLTNNIVTKFSEIALKIENSLIIPLVEMERVGFSTNKKYLETARVKLKDYIIEQRERLNQILEQDCTIGQHALIKSILDTKFDVELTSTGKEELNRFKSDLIRQGDKPLVVELIEIIESLRTLEKWYSTYIIRYLKQLQNTDRLYTTINQVGTVSGRVTSDFQQFPKDAIKDKDGNELFQPRKMIKVTGGNYDKIVYLDYSQIELRFQAFYTILVGHPDLNLCRAYMPYKCHTIVRIDPLNNYIWNFDHENLECIKQAYTLDWYYDENPTKKWTPTDVHGETTKAAFDITEDDPEYAHLRYIGKRVNFAKNYGAKYLKICSMFPDRSPEDCKKIDDAYYTAFPGVKKYHEYCYGIANYQSYATNLFGVRYYGVPGHNLVNMLVQGSAAYFLKLKIREVYDYIKSNNLQLRWQMQIHDELSFEGVKGEDLQAYFDIQNIMQDWSDTKVPIVADMEITTSTWAEKVGVNTLDEIQTHLGY